jgi:tetratricopeptide (TPR) repeat protein
MFGRASKIKRAVDRSVRAVLQGDGASAYAAIEKLRDDEKPGAYVDVCHRLIYEEDLEGAAAAVERALALAPTELYVLDARADVAVEDGRMSDALGIYRTMYELAPDDPAVIVGLADLLLANNDPEAAVALLEPHAGSGEAYVRLRLGEALYAADRAPEALELLEQVHDHYTSSLKHASFVDNFQELKNRLDEASRLRDDVYAELHGREASVVKHALSGTLDGRAGANYTLLGQSLAAEPTRAPSTLTLESMADTRARAEALLDHDPDDPVGLALLGSANLREGALEPALASFESATNADGRYFAGFLGLGAAMDCQAHDWFARVASLSAPGDTPGLEQVVPDWPALSELERRVVWASVEPLLPALPVLAAAGARIRILPIDVRATDLAELAENAGARFTDDHRSLDAIDGLATPLIAIAKIERLLDVVGDGAWTFAHELSHLAFFAATEAVRARVGELYQAALDTGYAVSEYQTTNADELFAVAYTDYLRHRHALGVTEALDEAGITEALFEVIEGLGPDSYR